MANEIVTKVEFSPNHAGFGLSERFDSATLIDYLAGTLPEEMMSEIDEVRSRDPEFAARITVVGKKFGHADADYIIDSRSDHGSVPERTVVLMAVLNFRHRGTGENVSRRSEIFSEVLGHAAAEAGIELITSDSHKFEALNSPRADFLVAEVTNAEPRLWFSLGQYGQACSTPIAIAFDTSAEPHLPERIGKLVGKKIPYADTEEGAQQLERELTVYFRRMRREHAKVPIDDGSDGIRTAVTRPALERFRSTLQDAVDEAQKESIPRKVIARAEVAVKNDDMTSFLESVKQLVESKVFMPSELNYDDMYRLADRVGARGKVSLGILEVGMEEYPGSKHLRQIHLEHLAHSNSADDRKMAKSFVHDMYGFDSYETGNLVAEFKVRSRNHDRFDVFCLALLLDAHHRDENHEEALRVTSILVSAVPGSGIARRNHARAMERLPDRFKPVEILAEYRASIHVDSPDYLSATWYADYLSTCGKKVDAVEALVLACMLDLDIAKSFAILGNYIASLVQPRNIHWSARDGGRRYLPKEISVGTVVKSILHAMSCPDYGVEAKKFCEHSMVHIGVGVDEIEEEMSSTGSLSRRDRAIFVEGLYDILGTNVTRTPDNINGETH